MSNPPIKGSRPYVIFDVTGKPVSFTPSFHVSYKMFNSIMLLISFVKFNIYHKRFHQFLDRVEALYDQGRPIHIARPDESIIKTFTYEAWKALSPAQMQQEQRERNVVVSGWPLRENISFNEEGLRKVAGTRSRQISINGKASFINPPHIYSMFVVQIIPSSLPTAVVGQRS